MSRQSFEEMYPEYKLIPEKTPKWRKLLLAMLPWAALGGLIAGGVYVLSSLGKLDMPVPNVAGVNALSVDTARNMALRQIEEGRYAEAAESFRAYFAWGGRDSEVMAQYAKALRALGHEREAQQWEQESKVKSLEGTSK